MRFEPGIGAEKTCRIQKPARPGTRLGSRRTRVFAEPGRKVAATGFYRRRLPLARHNARAPDFPSKGVRVGELRGVEGARLSASAPPARPTPQRGPAAAVGAARRPLPAGFTRFLPRQVLVPAVPAPIQPRQQPFGLGAGHAVRKEKKQVIVRLARQTSGPGTRCRRSVIYFCGG